MCKRRETPCYRSDLNNCTVIAWNINVLARCLAMYMMCNVQYALRERCNAMHRAYAQLVLRSINGRKIVYIVSLAMFQAFAFRQQQRKKSKTTKHVSLVPCNIYENCAWLFCSLCSNTKNKKIRDITCAVATHFCSETFNRYDRLQSIQFDFYVVIVNNLWIHLHSWCMQIVWTSFIVNLLGYSNYFTIFTNVMIES